MFDTLTLDPKKKKSDLFDELGPTLDESPAGTPAGDVFDQVATEIAEPAPPRATAPRTTENGQIVYPATTTTGEVLKGLPALAGDTLKDIGTKAVQIAKQAPSAMRAGLAGPLQPVADIFDGLANKPPEEAAPPTEEEARKQALQDELAARVKPAMNPILAPLLDTKAGKRATAAIASGATGTAGNMAAAVPAAEQFLLGKQTIAGKFGQKAADTLGKIASDYMPENPNFLDQLASGSASMAMFMIPGAGTEALTANIPRLGIMAAKLAPAIGSGLSAVMEAATEAGGVYQDQIRKGLKPEQAAKSAFHDFWSNVLLVGITNHFGIFGDKLTGVKKAITSASLEGLQEGSQSILASLTKNEPIDWKDVTTSAGVGSILGVGAGGALGEVHDQVGSGSTQGGPDGPGGRGAPRRTVITEDSLGPKASAYLKERFPGLFEGLNGADVPLTGDQIKDLLIKSSSVGEEVILKGGTPEEANQAASAAFMQAAGPLMEQGQAHNDTLKASQEKAAAKPTIEEQLQEFDPAKVEKATKVENTPEMPNDAQEPVSPEPVPPEPVSEIALPGKKIRLFKKEVESEAQYLYQKALEERDAKVHPLEEFVKENGGIATYRDVNGARQELEEYRGIPVRLRGQVPYDEMVQKAVDANILPADTAYGDLYDTLTNLPKRGEVPKVEDFYPEARRNLEFEKLQQEHAAGTEIPPDIAANYSARKLEDVRAKAKEAAQRILDGNKIDDRVMVHIVDQIAVDPEAFKSGYGTDYSKENYDVLGATYPPGAKDRMQSVIELAHGATESTGRHEAFHAVTNLLLDQGEQEIINKKYGDQEKAADAFAEFRAGKSTNDSLIDKVFQKIKDFLERLSNYFKSNTFATADDLFSKIDEGKLKDRAARDEFKQQYNPTPKPEAEFLGYQPMNGTPGYAEFEPLYNVPNDSGGVDTIMKSELEKRGVPVPPTPSVAEWKARGPSQQFSAMQTLKKKFLKRAEASRPETMSPEFKQWFGDSKIVDEQGNPLVVFHGTPNKFNEFDPARRELGFHFARDPQVSENRLDLTREARDRGYELPSEYKAGASIMPVYLKMENPVRLNEDVGDFAGHEMYNALIRANVVTEAEVDPILKRRRILGGWEVGQEMLRNLLKEKGYDGIVYKNQFENDKGMTDQQRESYIVFDPNQVKSAFNLGSWNPENADIRYSAKPKEDQTKTKEFQKWFEDSKVVDEKGKPLVVYHGTPADFTEFKGKRHWFISDPLRAADYAYPKNYRGDSLDEGANIKPLYVSLRNPKILTANEDWKFLSQPDADEKLKTQGYDGVLFKITGQHAPATEHLFPLKKGVPITYGFAFSSHQIKSATGNIGTFDPVNPDIRYSARKRSERERIDTEFGSTVALVNPTPAEAKRLFSKAKALDSDHPNDKGVRWFGAPDGNLYMWDASELEHASVMQAIGVRLTSDNYAGAGVSWDESSAEGVARRFRESPTQYSAQKKEEINAPTFYSQLNQTLEKKLPANASKEMIENILNGQDVKKDEVAWSGIKDWLADKKGMVSKKDVLEFLKQNQIQIKEVLKGEPLPVAEGNDKIALNLEHADLMQKRAKVALDHSILDVEARQKLSVIDNRLDLVNRRLNQLNGMLDKSKTTKFNSGKLILPGGENYRELLLTIPEVKQLAQQEFNKAIASGKSLIAAQDIAREKFPLFHSAHFSEPNVLAHIRFNERTDSEGKRVLFIEEIQSDWHQKGREKGYQGDGPTEFKLPYPEKFTENDVQLTEREHDWKLTSSKYPNVDFKVNVGKGIESTKQGAISYALRYFNGQAEGANKQAQIIQSEKGSKVPDAPFKKTWHELSLKRMLRWATENGFDKIAWTTGEQQAERYDLSKQIKQIDGVKTTDGKYHLKALGLDGQLVLENSYPREELPNVIGKEAATKLLAKLDEPIKPLTADETELKELSARSWKTDLTPEEQARTQALDKTVGMSMRSKLGDKYATLSGLDLKVGGEGMKGFYDQMIPSFLNKYTKKWGGKVGEAVLPKPVGFPTKAFDEHGGEIDYAKKVHSLDITPSMKQSVLGVGQPLYSAKIVPKYQAEERTPDLYEENRKLQPTLSESVIKDFKETVQAVGKAVDRVFGSMQTRLGNIDPSLRRAILQYEYRTANRTMEDLKTVEPFLKKIEKMSKDDKLDFDLARKNGDTTKVQSLVSKYNMGTEYYGVRKVLNDIYKRAKDVDFDLGYLENYFPRKIKDSKGFLDYMGRRDDWSIIKSAIEAKEEAVGRYLTVDEKVEVINSLIRGYSQGKISLSETGNMKDRKIDKVDALMNRFYYDSDAAMVRYVNEVNSAIEGRRFFGKGTKEKQGFDFGENAGTLDIDDSIGGYVLDLLNRGVIKPSQEKDVRDILQARFNARGPGSVVGIYRDLAYIDAMGSTISALTQIQDIGFALYRGGLMPTMYHLGRSLVGKPIISRHDVGVDKIAQEFSDPGRTYKALAATFKAIGLDKLDGIFKDVYINVVISKYQKQVKDPGKEFFERLNKIFGPETPNVIADLETGQLTENVKFLAFCELVGIQPITLSNNPEKYATAKNGRIFYMLKTFQLTQIDFYRNEAFQKMAQPGLANKVEGLRRLLYLSSCLALAGAGADVLKNILLNRPTYLPDMLVDNLLKLVGISKFIAYDARRNGIGEAAMKLMLPPFKLIDSVYKDFANVDFQKEGWDQLQGNFWQDKKLETPASIPLVGKFYYWWFGKGSEMSQKKRIKMMRKGQL